MATNFTVRQIVEAALRRVQSFANHDTGSDPDDYSIAVDNLDRMLSHYSAILHMQAMVRETVVIDIPAATNPLDIVSIAGTAMIPTRDFMSLDQMVLRKDGRDYELSRITRREYHEQVKQKDSGGFPSFVYIDRAETQPRVYLWPVLQLTGYQLVFTYFRFSAGVRSLPPESAHGLGSPWQMWMETQLAYIIGSGPVVRVENDLLSRWKDDAQEYREQLFGAYNTETKKPRRVKNWDF